MSADQPKQRDRQMRSAVREAVQAHRTGVGMVLVGLIAAGVFAAKRNRT